MLELSIKPDAPSGLGWNRFQNAFMHRRIERSVRVSEDQEEDSQGPLPVLMNSGAAVRS